ncbi:2,4-dienoyl-CoA reductase-like NADH-dependent reductase (Old Yellow Enzyme family) [Nonomuraea thailandensis]|uniref:2,4-dienoyl-CoA reductase-like NADH-dependent reductase (Old Yellow Enzyme family) n=1 Tax=Nonomuraea thailandensis TaxID=1188745 RepID=A0A9X2GXC6_9ACTN|nr:HisA/HisF-related TIM barrel protein [Nonomuraea thailandensis]MCP2365419.1 2,4-dienoyl-CoA reductase-like NADH-dependent reductase (Old Yellow Enzyme family) [Nonomuraea thailandensis]
MQGSDQAEVLFSPLTLPSGAVLRNRVAKASMEENLAAPGQIPDHRLRRLYRIWGAGGAGLLITGNVMVDARAMTGPAGVVLDARAPLQPFAAWAAAARSGGAAAWMQLNHPGRQVRADLGGVAWSPSGVPISGTGGFARPVAMDDDDIRAVITMFASGAARAIEAGFTGVQIHAAHGYLLSQFLSPLANRRTDRWGGPIEQRARLLIEVVRAVRAAMPAGAALGVKLNTADFQRGGFQQEDALRVVELLGEHPVDLVELSGGSAERPVMHGVLDERPVMHGVLDERTLAREAYFLDLAREVVAASPMPIMLTGGIRTAEGAQEVLRAGVAVVGVATALAQRPTLPRDWSCGRPGPEPLPPSSASDKATVSAAKQAAVRWILRRTAARGTAPETTDPDAALRLDARRRARLLRRYRAWLAGG